MNRLIFGVTHLCARTRELAQTPSPEPIALMPIRECLDLLERTLEELGNALEPAAPLPGKAPASAPQSSWLIGRDAGD